MRLASAAVLLALTACGTDVQPRSSSDPVDPGPDAGSSDPISPSPDGGMGTGGDAGQTQLTDCEEATTHSDLAWIQAKIFDASCLTGCHSGANPTSNMNLSDGRSWAALVNVPSNQYSGWVRVVPGDPARSMLMVQLGGEQGPQLEGTMPWGQPKLCDEKIDAIRRWILAGAPE